MLLTPTSANNMLLILTLMDAAAVVVSNAQHCLPGQQPQRNKITNEESCAECPLGSFSKKGRKCLLCSVCHQGQSEIRGCTRSGNRVCRCPQGTYLKGGAICVKCTTCTKGMMQTHECGHDMDRACRKCPSGWTTAASSNDRVCVAVRVKTTSSRVVVRHVVDWWVVLFVSATVVALGGCVALIYWRYRRRKKSNQRNSSRRSSFVRQTEMDDLRVRGERLAEAQKLVEIEDDAKEPTCNHRMVRDLSADIYEELGFKLNNNHPRNWVYLAGQLGFSMDQIRYLELQPRESTQNLINDWSSKPQSTVYSLHAALVKMNRPDAANLLKDFLYINKTENNYQK